MKASSRITGAWLGTFATNGITLAIGMATGILAARLLLPEGRGALAAILFWPGLLWNIGLLSFGDAVTYRISKSDLRDQPATTTTALCLSIALAAIIAALAAALMPHLLGAEREALWPMAQIFALTYIPMLTIGTVLLAVDQGRLRFRRYNLLSIIRPAVYFCGLTMLWMVDFISVTAAVVAFWLGMAVAVLVQIAGKVPDLRAWPNLREGRPLLELNLRFFSTNLAFLLGSHVDRLVLMLFWDDATIGLYIVALNWASAGMNVMMPSFQTVMFSYVSAEANPDRQRALLARGLRYACLLLVAGTAVLLLLTPWLLPLLFGQAFLDAVPITLVLIAGLLPFALRQIIVRSLRGFGEAKPGTTAEVMGIVSFLVCAWPLIWLFDLLGIAVAVMLANLLSLVYLISYLRWRFHLGIAEWWGVNARTVGELVGLSQGLYRAYRARNRRMESAAGRETPLED